MQQTLIELGGLFTSAFISATIVPGGSEAVLAYLVAQAHYSVTQLVMLASVGNTLGAMTTWALGLLAAKKFPVADLLPENKQKALATVKKNGLWILLFSWLPIIGDAFCFAGGWLKMPLFRACLLIWLGKVARYWVVAWLFV
ncbi:MAG: YqaA family protein [Methylococcales bacterium]